jgi:DNA-directed RNA polymerase
LPHALILCCTKAGSNVLERCLQTADQEESKKILKSIVESQTQLQKIIKDKYGNYVIQKMLKILPYEQRNELTTILIEYFEQLEENPRPNSFENFVYQVVMDKRPKQRH